MSEFTAMEAVKVFNTEVRIFYDFDVTGVHGRWTVHDNKTWF